MIYKYTIMLHRGGHSQTYILNVSTMQFILVETESAKLIKFGI